MPYEPRRSFAHSHQNNWTDKWEEELLLWRVRLDPIFSGHSHKQAWEKVRQELVKCGISHFTTQQCKDKLQNIKKHYIKIQDHNRKSGNYPKIDRVVCQRARVAHCDSMNQKEKGAKY